METLTLAQALRHMAERAEAGSDTPWDDLQWFSSINREWGDLACHNALRILRDRQLRIKLEPKIVNGVECHPHRGELEPDEIYSIPSSMEQKGFVTGYGRSNFVKFAHARGSAYTTAKGALVEARAQGWV